jgi:hypothetical protein
VQSTLHPRYSSIHSFIPHPRLSAKILAPTSPISLILSLVSHRSSRGRAVYIHVKHPAEQKKEGDKREEKRRRETKLKGIGSGFHSRFIVSKVSGSCEKRIGEGCLSFSPPVMDDGGT